MALLSDVFGVSAKHILSYIERDEVDSKFQDAVATDKQIVVYGSSKQGKTALVSKHLPYDDNIVISLTPRTNLIDIYQGILSKSGIRIVSGATEQKSTESNISFGAKVKAMVPLFGGGEASFKGGTKAGSGTDISYEEIPINLELPQSVADLLAKIDAHRWIILENFHYLNDEVQKQFAFDLRAFQELEVRFVILGVWREKNRMSQFNGDLLDRVVEVPVEPWTENDFRKVSEKGLQLLNVSISPDIINKSIEASFSSIGVYQELMKGVCLGSGVSYTQIDPIFIDNMELLEVTILNKANEYASRHQRALEAIAAGHSSGGAKGDLPPLYLPYYLIRVLIESGYEGVASGMRRPDLHEKIKAIHHRGDDVRASDISNLLGGLSYLQASKSISPPIFDYDQQKRLLQIVDSTFYFFIKNSNKDEILETIQNPLGAG